MILSEEKAQEQIDNNLQTGRANLKKPYTDPIIQIKKRLKELDAEWVRIMNVDSNLTYKDGKEYRLFRRQRFNDAEYVSKLIRQNNEALNLLETVLNGIQL